MRGSRASGSSIVCAALGGLRRLGDVDLRRRRLRRNRLEVLAHLLERGLGVDVADDRDHGVVRRVVGLEERRDVFHRRRAQIRHRADHRVLVREVLVGQLVDDLEGAAVGLIVHAEAALLLDRVDLVVELLLRDHQRPHPVGLEEQREIELVGRQDLEVERPILVGRAVHAAAVHEHQIGMLAGTDVLGALEHHVLEQVREPGAALALVARADVVVHRNREDRRGVILRDDHAQPVLEAGVGELDPLDRRRAQRQAGHCRQSGDAPMDASLRERFMADLLEADGRGLTSAR